MSSLKDTQWFVCRCLITFLDLVPPCVAGAIFWGSPVPGPEGEWGRDVGIQVSPAEQQLWRAMLPEGASAGAGRWWAHGGQRNPQRGRSVSLLSARQSLPKWRSAQ